MYLIYFALGAFVGAVVRDRRALASILPAAAVLVFIGLRDHHFASWAGGLIWFFGLLACFEFGLVLGGLAASWLRRPEPRPGVKLGRRSVARVN